MNAHTNVPTKGCKHRINITENRTSSHCPCKKYLRTTRLVQVCLFHRVGDSISLLLKPRVTIYASECFSYSACKRSVKLPPE